MKNGEIYKISNSELAWDGKVIRIEDCDGYLPFGLTGKAVVFSFVEFPNTRRVILKRDLKRYKGKLPSVFEDAVPCDFVLNDCVGESARLHGDEH